jgi:hypothetical protein
MTSGKHPVAKATKAGEEHNIRIKKHAIDCKEIKKTHKKNTMYILYKSF